MRLKDKQLLGLPVRTKSGDKLGKVSGFEFDPFSQRIMKYEVKPHPGLPSIIEKELLISYDQVISLSEKEMVVDDLTIKGKETSKQKRPAQA